MQPVEAVTQLLQVSGTRVFRIRYLPAELGDLGVRRVSSGSLPYRAAVDAAVNVATALRDGKQAPAATPYWEMQARLVAFSQRLTD